MPNRVVVLMMRDGGGKEDEKEFYEDGIKYLVVYKPNVWREEVCINMSAG